MSCGCKGVRWCALCAETPRVKALRYPDQTVNYSDLTPYLYCPKCAKAHRLEERREYEMQELWMLGNASAFCSEGGGSRDASDFLELQGLLYIPDFLTSDEEELLVEKIDSQDWAPSQSGRRKQDYSPQGVPSYASPILEKFATYPPLRDYRILELCNLEYDPCRASQIEFHIDDTWIWGERLISINLLDGAVMTLLGPFDRNEVKGYSSSSKLNILLSNGEVTGETSNFANEQSSILDGLNERNGQLLDLEKNAGDCNGVSRLENCSERSSDKREMDRSIIYIPMSRRSLLSMYAEVRYTYKHAIMKHHIANRRIALTMREPEAKFLERGQLYEKYGQEMMRIADQVVVI